MNSGLMDTMMLKQSINHHSVEVGKFIKTKKSQADEIECESHVNFFFMIL